MTDYDQAHKAGEGTSDESAGDEMRELTGLIKAMKETHLDTIKHLQHGFGYTEDRLKSADVDAYAFLRLIAALEKAIEQRNVQYRTKHIYEGVSWPILQPAIDRADMELVKILLRDAPHPNENCEGDDA